MRNFRKRALRITARPALVTLALLSFLLFARLVTGPLHVAGTAQPLMASVNRLAHLAGAPGTLLAARRMTGAYRQRTFSAFAFSLAWNGAVYFALFVAAEALLASLRRKTTPAPVPEPVPDEESSTRKSLSSPSPGHQPESAPPNASSPPLLTRRAFLRVGAGNAALLAGAAAVAGTGGYSIFVEPGRLLVSRHRFALRGLPLELSGLRVVHLTDIHHGPWLSIEMVRRVIATANGLRPDLVVVTGDHVVAGDQYIRPVARALAGLRPRMGVLSTLGNHDWWSGEGKVRDAFRQEGLTLIDNTCRFLTPEGRLQTAPPATGRGLCLAGLGDLWEDGADFWKALGPAPEEMPRLVLSHNPDAAESPDLPRSGERIDLMLSGHTHGGQIRLPLVGAPVVPSRFGQKYARGLVQGPHCPVYVSRGIGLTVLPVRLGAPPEIALFEFYPA